MTDTLVIGGGPAGLTMAIALARQGADVTVVEQDASEPPADVRDAFARWDRHGVPQLRHSHAFLARLRKVLIERAPDILDALFAHGGRELRFLDHLPATITDRSPRPGDDELVGLALRRVTFEWVLRDVAHHERVTFLSGAHVDGLVVQHGDVPNVVGVSTGNDTLAAGLVIDATGRNSALPDWLTAAGVAPLHEEHADVGLLYYSRFYRIIDPARTPVFTGQIGGDIGFLKFGIFPGDDDTFSITMGTAKDDKPLRPVRDPAVFDALASVLPITSDWMASGVEPLTDDVALMARMRNRRRCLVIDGRPVATSILPIGDAAVCTNPLYGRGTSLALAHAFEVADAITAGTDPIQLSLAVDTITRAALDPWYRASVAQDQVDSAPTAFFAAVRSDADVWRAFVRTFNLLSPPEAMLADPHVQAKVLEAMAAGDAPEGIEGAPSRDEVLAIIEKFEGKGDDRG